MTERTVQHPRHQHHQRPPDVEAALSSMLWTPYERNTPTDSSSEDDDDDERLNKKLHKSPSRYDYCGVVAPPPTFEPLTTSYFGAANNNDEEDNDLMLRTATAVGADVAGETNTTTMLQSTPPFVPLPNVIFSINSGNGGCLETTTNSIAVGDHRANGSPITAATTTTNYQKNHDLSASHFRFSYPYYGPIPSLNKWWSASMATTTAAKEPPSYESLYSKTGATRSKGSLKPVLNSLKATVSTSTSSPGRQQQQQEYCDSSRSSQDSDGFHGRIVHSFTDDFISQSYAVAELLPQSPSIDQQPNARQHVATTNVDFQQKHIMQVRCEDSTTTQELQLQQQLPDEKLQQMKDFVPLPAEQAEKLYPTNARSKQNKEKNNNNCTSSNHRNHLEQQQFLPCAKEENEETTNRDQHQVNQPAASVERCGGAYCATAMNSRTAVAAMNTTFSTTPTMNSSSDKATKNNSDAAQSKQHQHQRLRPVCDAVSVHANVAQPPTISRPSSFDECTSPLSSSSSSGSLPVSPQSHSHYWKPRNNFESCLRTTSVVAAVSPYQLPTDNGAEKTASNALTPNKCLAELERLYAEFRASESLVTQRNGSDLLSSSSSSVKMRLNIPAAVAAAAATETVIGSAVVVPPDNQALKIISASTPATTSSSVFLTTTNSVTTNNSAAALSNNNNNSCCNNSYINHNNNSSSSKVAILSSASPCQRQPSLTIQVNNNNNNNNVNLVAPKSVQNLDFMLNQSIVNNNGVSVVNCSYVHDSNNIDNKSNNSRGFGVGVTSSASSSVNVNNNNNNSPVPKVFSNNCATNSSVAVASNLLKNNLIQNVATTIDDGVNVINVNTQSRNATAALASPTANSPTLTESRTFTSTECQTDDIAPVQLRTNRIGAATSATMQQPPQQNSSSSSQVASSREQRRRERRERRHHQQQQLFQQSNSHMPPPPPPPNHHRRHSERHSLPPVAPMTHLHPPHMHHASLPATHATMPAAMSAMLRPMLPDILHSHFPPPYSALPVNAVGGGGRGPPPPLPLPQSMMRPLPPPPPPPPNVTTLLSSVISTVPIPGATPIMNDGHFTLPLPIIRRSPSERSGKGCCGQWFAGPPLRALIAVVALGGVACALGGAALGATGLAGPPSSHLTAALLMIGVGVVLVTVSGAAWRMTAPGGPPCLGLGSSVDLGRCGRRPCSRGGGAPHGLLYPEFQHRPPPPSYQASMQEYRLRLLLLDRDRQNGVVRGNSPPPTYRSHAGSMLRAPLTTTSRGASGGSEYSLPPSYRSRNATPAQVCSERNIETAPSGRLLANEDIPEPLSVAEQLAEYSALQLHLQRSAAAPTTNRPHHTPKTTTSTTARAHSSPPIQLHTSAIVEVEAAIGGGKEASSANGKLNPRVFGGGGAKDTAAAPANGKDLVTIVTISQTTTESDRSSEVRTAGGAAAHPAELIEILAHL